jgi:hypothetical protein
VLSCNLKLGRWLHKESKLAHYYLDGLNGIEIGASQQNAFGNLSIQMVCLSKECRLAVPGREGQGLCVRLKKSG